MPNPSTSHPPTPFLAARLFPLESGPNQKAPDACGPAAGREAYLMFAAAAPLGPMLCWEKDSIPQLLQTNRGGGRRTGQGHGGCLHGMYVRDRGISVLE